MRVVVGVFVDADETGPAHIAGNLVDHLLQTILCGEFYNKLFVEDAVQTRIETAFFQFEHDFQAVLAGRGEAHKDPAVFGKLEAEVLQIQFFSR